MVERDDVADGDRYYRYVAFSATLVGPSWIATLTSDDADTYMVLWEWDADQADYVLVDSNDDLEQDNANSRIEWTPVQGQHYLLDLTTYTANTLGEFTFTLEEGTASAQGQGSTGEQSIGQSDLQGAMPFERRQ